MDQVDRATSAGGDDSNPGTADTNPSNQADAQPGLQPSPPTDTRDDEILEYPTVETAMEASTGLLSNARDLSAADWRLVMETNQLLYGFQIREQNHDVVRARHNAFVLKYSNININRNRNQKPYFQVEDGSSIQVQETKNEFQRSLARNAFSRSCIVSDLSVGAFGAMLGLSGLRERENSSTDKEQTSLRDQEYYAVFNFPRARVLLDEEELQLSKECETALLEIQNQQSFSRLQRFYKLFGHIFVTSILLGGQQRTSKFAAALEIQDKAVQQDALRGAVGAKINAQYLSASAQFSREQEGGESRTDQRYSNLSYLGMSASGGDTLIGSDVPKWASTVAPFKNWRVIENEIAEPIHELIGRIPGWDHIPEIFQSIINSRSAADRPWTGRLSLLINNEPLCWNQRDRSLRPRGSCDKPSETAIFTILDAYSTGPVNPINMSRLLADWPIFLRSDFSSTKHAVDIQSLNVVWVEPAAYMTGGLRAQLIPSSDISRFSIRLAGTSGPWNPTRQPPQMIKSGDQVNLYCHSMGLGPYANVSRPPTYASPALCDLSNRSICFVTAYDSFSPMVRSLITAYDGRSIPAEVRDAFEKMGIISVEEFAPGPNLQTVITSKGYNSEVSVIGLKTIGLKASSSFQKTTEVQYTVVGGKKVRIDYKKLQKEPYKSAPLDWDRCREEIALKAERSGPGFPNAQTFTVVFE